MPDELQKFADLIEANLQNPPSADPEERSDTVQPTEGDHEAVKDQIVENMQRRIDAEIVGESVVIYAAYPYDENRLPIDNLDMVAVTGRTRSEDEIWDSYIGEIVENPTWLKLALEANRMMIASEDHHHVAFESVQVLRETEDGIKILSLDFGS